MTKTLLLHAAAAIALGGLLFPPQADAAGCLKGAAVGGVAGHMAGHHGLLGAGAGCAVGHHEASKHQRQGEQAARANSTDQDNGSTSTGRR